MCQLAEVSRAGFYRYRNGRRRSHCDLPSRMVSSIIDGATDIGGVTEEIRARGMIVNHKRIARIMREDNLLVVRQDRSRPHGHTLRAARVYLNLATRMTLLGPNQLWVADITYIRLACEFVYLAVVLDVFSRKVIGWALGRSLKAQLPIIALARAIANRRPPPGVVHHSDQGVQYACSQGRRAPMLRFAPTWFNVSLAESTRDNAFYGICTGRLVSPIPNENFRCFARAAARAI
jgi:transposase InsO family protein